MLITIEEILANKLLALSWKEPYGTLMYYNKIETRTWYTKYRGLVMICCSKTGYSQKQIFNISGETQFERILGTLSRDMTPMYGQNMGKAILIGRLVDCRPMTKEDESDCFVQYFPGLFCHVYKDVRPIKPFPWKGSQGWTRLTQEQIEKIELI
jgi:hypothetical protein